MALCCCARANDTLTVRELATGTEQIAVVTPESGLVFSSPDLKRIVAGNGVTDGNTGELLFAIADLPPAEALVFTSNGHHVVAATSGTVRRWSTLEAAGRNALVVNGRSLGGEFVVYTCRSFDSRLGCDHASLA